MKKVYYYVKKIIELSYYFTVYVHYLFNSCIQFLGKYLFFLDFSTCCHTVYPIFLDSDLITSILIKPFQFLILKRIYSMFHQIRFVNVKCILSIFF